MKIDFKEIVLKKLEDSIFFTNEEIANYLIQEIIKNRIDYPIEKAKIFVNRVISEYIQSIKKSGIEYINISAGKHIKIFYQYNLIEINSKIMFEKEKLLKIKEVVEYIEKNKFDNEMKNLLSNKIFSEALSSSIIEGSTIRSKDEYRKRDKENFMHKNNDMEILEVNENERTIEYLNASDDIEILNFNIRQIHTMLFEKLIETERYSGGNVGEYKKKQNYINLGFKPANPLQVDNLMEGWINDYNLKPVNLSDAISRASQLHGEFESIHPFDDGNGRIGRILFGYYFKMHKISSSIYFDLSEEISKDKKRYYDSFIESYKTKSYKPIANYLFEILYNYFEKFIEKS